VTPVLVLGTRNDHKVREFARLLGGAVEVQPLPDGLPSPEETGETFADNALIKARAAAEGTGQASIADDSGIGAEVLGWRPGVRSARFAGEDATDEANLARLEAEVPPGSRLRYSCVIAHVAADGTQTLFEGTCEGTMAPGRRGAGGFGYDPVFVPDGLALSSAELEPAEKDARSHRGQAFAALVPVIARVLGRS
jgi:XTP/dITP diphosphohydrolase